MGAVEIIAIYLVAINILGFVLMGVDKWKAKSRKWRIPEASLFFVAILGGSVGSIIGIYTFRHKTKHKKFTIGMPIILVIQVALVIWLLLSPLELFAL